MSVVQQILKDSKGGHQANAIQDTSDGAATGLRLLGRSAERLELGEVLDLYKSVGRRNIEYFAWIHDVYSWITLPSVSFDCRKDLGDDKTKLTVFDILVDDLADNYETRSYPLLQRLANIPWQSKAEICETDPYFDVGRRIWEDSISSLSGYPRFNEFERIFYFDLRQVLSSMMYSYLGNTARIENPIETNFYSSYGCLVEVAMDMDLMCSPAFDMRELGPMRTVACLAQKIAHVGNMLTTYPSEVVERDVSSPIISLALRKGIIREDELGDKAAVPKVSKLEWVFKNKAYSYIKKVAEYEKEIRSINIRGFSNYLVELIERFEGSRSLR
ncbi:MAG TPA: hypothetical protein VEL71_04710 [Candidatus Dormibacteraeota bacterium]|nr:hypothetical protein [Candidatus Dormibacteraeota bacterium]